MRTHLVAGNWKMHTHPKAGLALVQEILSGLGKAESEVWVFPPATHLSLLAEPLAQSPVKLGAQNAAAAAQGAYTGELSVSMLKACGAQGLLIGHSERRQLFGETGKVLNQKLERCLEEDLTPFLCVGETLEERESGNHMEVVRHQIEEATEGFDGEALQTLVIAYEPVWAIGTGQTASPFQAQEMHAFIRRVWAKKFGESAAEKVRILYGGSVKPENAAELFGQTDIDGGLIGGASLKAADFLQIVQANPHYDL